MPEALKKRNKSCFPTNFAKFLKTPFFHRTPLVAASDTRRLWKVVYNDVAQCYSEFFYFTKNEGSLILLLKLVSDY